MRKPWRQACPHVHLDHPGTPGLVFPSTAEVNNARDVIEIILAERNAQLEAEREKLLTSLATECGQIKNMIENEMSNSLATIQDLGSDWIPDFKRFKQSRVYKTQWKQVNVNHVAVNRRKVKLTKNKMRKAWTEDQIEFFLKLNPKESQAWMRAVGPFATYNSFRETIIKINKALWQDQIKMCSGKLKIPVVGVIIIRSASHIPSDYDFSVSSEKLDKYNLAYGPFGLLIAKETSNNLSLKGQWLNRSPCRSLSLTMSHWFNMTRKARKTNIRISIAHADIAASSCRSWRP